MPGENCLNFNFHCSRAAPGISVFGVPTKNDKYYYCKTWRNNIVAVVTCDMVMKTIQKDKLKTKHFALHYPQENMIFHTQIIIFSIILAIGQKYWSFT